MADVFEWMDAWGPEKIIVVHDTKTGMKGMLVIDNTARGPGKGGCRMDANMTLMMSWESPGMEWWKLRSVPLPTRILN